MSTAGEARAEPRPEGRDAVRLRGGRRAGVGTSTECKEAEA